MFTPKPRPLSAQDAFNNVWQHFIVENHPRAVNPKNDTVSPFSCLYRVLNDNGTPINGCAIGCQLPNDLYDPIFEGHSFHGLFSASPSSFQPLPDSRPRLAENSTVQQILFAFQEYFSLVDVDFLSRLQNAHDIASDNENLRDKLIYIAETHHVKGRVVK